MLAAVSCRRATSCRVVTPASVPDPSPCVCVCARGRRSVKPKAAHLADLKRFVPSAALRGTSPHEFWDVGVVGQGGAVFTMRM